MSTPAVKTPVTLSVEDMKRLTSRHRPRFSDEQVMAALKYQLDNNCTLAVAAATQGMTNQTLAKRRDEIAEKMGVKIEEPDDVKVSSKQASKPAKQHVKK